MEVVKNDLSIINDDNFSKEYFLEIAKKEFWQPNNIIALLSSKNIERLQLVIKQYPLFMIDIANTSTSKLGELFVLWKNIKKEYIWDKEYIISRNEKWYIRWIFDAKGKVSPFSQIAIDEKAKEIKYKESWFFEISDGDIKNKKVYIIKEWQLFELKELNDKLKGLNSGSGLKRDPVYDFEDLFGSMSDFEDWDLLPRGSNKDKIKELTKWWIKIKTTNWEWKHYYYNIDLDKWYFANSFKILLLEEWILALNIRTNKWTEKYIDLKTWEEIDKPEEEYISSEKHTGNKMEWKIETVEDNSKRLWRKVIQRAQQNIRKN